MKLLIANRGEIAVRVMRAAREVGWRTVAVYSQADARAQHVRAADEAVLLGPPPPRESYLNVEAVLHAARQTGAQAIHPGYGFLSENAAFAEAVQAAGLVWVGPPPAAMRHMGSKTEARALMQAHGVPVVPGFQPMVGAPTPLAVWQAEAERMSYPVLVKAAGGGGGRGMRVVTQPADLPAALESAQREAASAFGDDRVFLEKYLPRAKHIEFQVLGDTHGHVVHLFERECSLQRRHQKVIEEAPSPLLAAHPDLRARMGAAAVQAARAVHYTNAGTVEFIVHPDTLDFYFLEMNTRLQVEHPVTEAVTGLDLVHLQLHIASGGALPFAQDEVTLRGHALEARVCAEDPAHDFMPSVGALLHVQEPRGPGLRVDAGFASGDTVSEFYDSLLAKVIAHAPTRAEAIRRLDAALGEYAILGLTTNLAFLRALLAHPVVQAGEMTTRFIGEALAGWHAPAPTTPQVLAAALAEALRAPAPAAASFTPRADSSPWARADGFRLSG